MLHSPHRASRASQTVSGSSRTRKSILPERERALDCARAAASVPRARERAHMPRGRRPSGAGSCDLRAPAPTDCELRASADGGRDGSDARRLVARTLAANLGRHIGSNGRPSL
jgi:hypothetical protein